MSINELIARGIQQPNFVNTFQTAQANQMQIEAARQEQMQKNRINQLLQEQAGNIFGGASTPISSGTANGWTDTDKQNARLLMAAGDVSGLNKLRTDVASRSAKQSETTFNQEQGLRKEFDKASEDFIKVRDAHTRVLRSAENPSPAGDLALVFNYMKVLDPGSTVREGEFKNAQSAKAELARAQREDGLAIPNIVQGAINQMFEGTLLLDEQRADFVNRSGALYGGALENQKGLEGRYKGLAERGRLNSKNVVFEYRLPSGKKTTKPVNQITVEEASKLSLEEMKALLKKLEEGNK